MFKNRSLQVKMVKDDDGDEYVYGDWFEQKAAAVGEQVKECLFMIVGAVLVYVAADTIRQVAVEMAKK